MTDPTPLQDERAEGTIHTSADRGVEDRAVVALTEEFLTVGKRVEETGVVRVHTRTTERSETVHSETTHEKVAVERIRIDRIVDGPVEVRQEGDTTIVPVLEEVLVVEKRLMLREEVRITRTRTTVPEERNVILRKQEAVIEREAPTE